MQHQQHQNHLDLMANFPWEKYSEGPRLTQTEMMGRAQENLDSIGWGRLGSINIIEEAPTGHGKTEVGIAFSRTLEKDGRKPLFYITPTKSAADEVNKKYPETRLVYGRNEYHCLYYRGKEEREIMADEVPCSMLDCPHRVDRETGETKEPEAEPCPYLNAKYRARQRGIVVCTMAFYLFEQLYTEDWEIPAGLVIDEVHRIARVVRNCLSYEITDYHLRRSIRLLERIDPPTAQVLEGFLNKMIRIISQKPALAPTLLEDHEIRELMDELVKIKSKEVEEKLRQAVGRLEVDPEEEREVLARLEQLIRDIRGYYLRFEYSLETPWRRPLNYTYAYYRKALEKWERVQYQLFLKAHNVTGPIQKILSPLTLAYSGTVGDPRVLGWETGIIGPFYTFPSEFPVNNTRVYTPINTPNLAQKSRKRGEPARVMRKIAKACQDFSEAGIRSLVIVVSETERARFRKISQELGLEVISYSEEMKAKDAVRKFKEREGQVLLGTVAQYGESIDLPKNIVPVIFFLRPGYPKPGDPANVFEEKKWGIRNSWKLKNWRVMIEALQVRGRNIRYPEDLGVTFFISQQFRRFLYGALPEWLRDAYRGKLTLAECLKEAKEILSV